MCAIGDAACDATEHMVPVYCGVDRKKPLCDNFNYYASQLRIRVEMAFGLMTRKWGVLQRPCTTNLSNATWMLQAIARLHNCVVTERLLETGEAEVENAQRDNGGRRRCSYLPSAPEDEHGNPIRLDALFAGTFEGHSELRLRMAEHVRCLQLTRPVANRLKQP